MVWLNLENTSFIAGGGLMCWLVVWVNSGVTQELIDETRLSTENEMLADLEKLSADGGSLEGRGDHGETPVWGYDEW